jgi:hypothetical protein
VQNEPMASMDFLDEFAAELNEEEKFAPTMPAEGSVVGSLFSGMRSYISKEIQKTAEIGKALREKAATRV